MHAPLSEAQLVAIRALLERLELGPSGLLVALDTRDGARLVRRGEVELRHRECAEDDPLHRPRGIGWACERHGLFGVVVVAADRIGVLSVSSELHSERQMEELGVAALRIGWILRNGDAAAQALVSPRRGGGPPPAHAYAELPEDQRLAPAPALAVARPPD